MRRRREHEVDTELAFHVDMEAEKYERAGCTPEEARRRAQVVFGGVERYREATLDARRSRPLDDFLRDIRQGARSLLRTPVHSAVAALTLAVGIGAATALFSVVNGVLLRPLVYGDAERLYLLYEATEAGGQRPTSYLSFLDWEQQATPFDAMAFIRGDEFRMRGEEGTQRLLAGYVSDGFFETVQTQPLLGRAFDASDGHVLLLSHELWQRRFEGRTDVLGTAVSTADGTYTVVGVMPPGFRLPQWADVWIPIRAIPASAAFALTRRDLRVDAEAWGLRAAAVTEAAAQEDLGRVIAGLADAYPDAGGGDWRSATLIPVRDNVVGNVGEQLRIVMAAVALLLLVGCVNVAGLQLARSTARVRELAVRAALGAGRGRLVRQLLTESLLVAAVGGVLGVLLAVALVDLLAARLPLLLPRMDEVGVDLRVLGFATAVTLGTALIAGALPAVRSTALGLAPALREGTGGAGTSGRALRVRHGLVVAQVALAVVLSIGAGLLLRSLWTVQSTDLGFRAEGSVALRVFPPPQYDDADAAAALYRELQEAVRRVPGVADVALSNHLPLAGGVVATIFETAFEPPAGGQATIIRTVSREYFDVMGSRLVSGRLLLPEDFDGAGGGIVINTTTARDFFGDADPVGETVTLYHTAQGRPEFGEAIRATVVGVVEAERFLGIEQNAPRAVFVPWTWMVWPNISLVARTTLPPEQMVAPLRRAVQQVDQDIPVAGPGRQAEWRTMQSFAADSLQQRRVMAWLLASFALAAVGLAALGLFGVLAWLVAQRTREIGVRTALGASRSRVAGLVASRALALVGIGIGVGVPAAFAATRVLQSQLAGVAPTDPLTAAAAAATFLVAALVAAAVPTVRALRIQPSEALRAE
jgi:putative ABC transport system permease protein